MGIANQIQQQIYKGLQKGWDKIFIAIDLHGTCIVPDYGKTEKELTFYPQALSVLAQISAYRPDIVMIMYTCSHPEEIIKYNIQFLEYNIRFRHINENPEVKTGNDKYGCYDKKFYRNVTIDNTAGFDPFTEWKEIDTMLIDLPMLWQNEKS